MKRLRIWRGRGVGAAAVVGAVLCLYPWGPVLGRDPSAQDKIYALPRTYEFRHNIGLLDLLITNIGVIGNPLGLNLYGAGWRGGEYLYAAAMWVGAVASDNLAYVSTGAYEYELRPSLDPVDTIYPSYEGAPGGNRPGFSTQPDDDRDGFLDEDPLNGRDDDGDGPGVGQPCPPGVRGCDEDYAAISQQMFACEYWDYTDEARARYAEHRPLNIRIRQNSYAWSTEGSNEFVGFDFNIKNDGFELLRRLYLGFFVDSDVGPRTAESYWTDDGGAYYTTDTLFVDPTITFRCVERVSGEDRDCSEQKIHMDICYMYDIPDDGESAKGGDVPGYFGGMFLGHTTDPTGERAPSRVQVHTARFFSSSNAYPLGDPTNDTERYDLLQSGSKPPRPTTQPSDYRYCFSAGPFAELNPGEELQLQVAFVIGQGKEQMLTNALNAQRVYNGKWRNVDEDRLGRTGIYDPERGGLETCLRALGPGEPAIWRDPCDSLNPTVVTVKDTECLPDNYVDNDCSCCTPLFQTQADAASNQPGLETLVNWVGTVSPPSPKTNIDEPGGTVPAGDRTVMIAWDNLSELTADPLQRRILFTGYKIWRVEGWNRPVGAAGPAPDDWQLIADLSLEPEDSLGAESESYLRKYRNDIDSLYAVITGSAEPDEDTVWYYPVGRYSYRDTAGLKNGMIYFYDVTAYSAWYEPRVGGVIKLEGRPSATERDGIFPRWSPKPVGELGEIYVVPNPYIRGENPDGWDLAPSDADPTGTKLAFVGLPNEDCTVKIYTLAGDLVQTLDNEADAGRRNEGAVFWNLISRNGQDIVSGVYIYLVECNGKSKVGRFVVVR